MVVFKFCCAGYTVHCALRWVLGPSEGVKLEIGGSLVTTISQYTYTTFPPLSPHFFVCLSSNQQPKNIP